MGASSRTKQQASGLIDLTLIRQNARQRPVFFDKRRSIASTGSGVTLVVATRSTRRISVSVLDVGTSNCTMNAPIWMPCIEYSGGQKSSARVASARASKRVARPENPPSTISKRPCDSRWMKKTKPTSSFGLSAVYRFHEPSDCSK